MELEFQWRSFFSRRLTSLAFYDGDSHLKLSAMRAHSTPKARGISTFRNRRKHATKHGEHKQHDPLANSPFHSKVLLAILLSCCVCTLDLHYIHM